VKLSLEKPLGILNGRQEIVGFLTRKWAKELDYRLIKELWVFQENRTAVRFAREWHATGFALTETKIGNSMTKAS
jgi:nuclear transport factor 2 (NTF2) superfamily protein